MSSKRKIGCWLVAIFVALSLATWAKTAMNDFSFRYWHAYSRPDWSAHAMSPQNAKQQGLWVADMIIEPKIINANGKTFEFKEAWLQAAYYPNSHFVWFNYSKRTAWDYLCVRTQTNRRENDVEWPPVGPLDL
jgi:hypothetical protein